MSYLHLFSIKIGLGLLLGRVLKCLGLGAERLGLGLSLVHIPAISPCEPDMLVATGHVIGLEA